MSIDTPMLFHLWRGRAAHLTALFILVGACGCAVVPSVHVDEGVALRGSIYDRGDVQFQSAVLVKPRVGETPILEVTMAPLILLETRADTGDSRPNGFESVALTGHAPRADGSNAVVYFRRSGVTLSGAWHPQLTYYWLSPAGHASECRLPLQGVRLTLNTLGTPIIWEILADCSGVELMFVAESIEAAAREDFTEPLPGRKFVSERSLAEAPNAVVARVLQDGPVPMGPIVYVQPETGAAVTVICRCMPAQADHLAGEQVYDLVELTPEQELELLANRHALFQPGSAMSVEQWLWPDRIVERLRLPVSHRSSRGHETPR